MGIRFRIANWICGDYLRNYLAVGVLLPLDKLLERDKRWENKRLPEWDRREIERIEKCVREIFEL